MVQGDMDDGGIVEEWEKEQTVKRDGDLLHPLALVSCLISFLSYLNVLFFFLLCVGLFSRRFPLN